MEAQGDAIGHARFVRGFVRLCDDGWRQGWHERNGGNVSYRLTAEEAAFVRGEQVIASGAWAPLAAAVPALGKEMLLVTATGCYLRNIAEDPAANIGIVEIDPVGAAWRVAWGFANGARPTSELSAHLMNHAALMRRSDGCRRVLYHAHPTNVIAMTFVVPLEARAFSRALWKAMTECVMVFPAGVGVVPCMVPGSVAIAEESARLVGSYDAVVWAHHGLFAAGETFDAAFGLMHAVEKAAGIYCRARCMNGGSDDFMNTIDDEQLREIARGCGVVVNEALLG